MPHRMHSCFDQESVSSFIIRALGQRSSAISLFEFTMELEAPSIDFFPRLVSATNPEQHLSVLIDAHRHKALPQNRDAREQQPNQVHGMLPLERALCTEILLQLLELRHHVAVVGLVHNLREKDLFLIEKLVGNLGLLLNEGSI